MKASLNFDLSDPQDKSSFKIHAKAMDLFIAIKSFEGYLRDIKKYGDLEKPPESTAILDEIRLEFYNQMEGLLDDY